ncbi:hypothetical protein QA640_04680 [Bradyrhizobium sp. CB82]|uniref:hypothetical protein n=1 Tax=Bradyrhizobium sp. CB82 TaxID=3039159 RepID=UPI0024B16C96|nr:hypothetical protein [Bradyrhizobium sp. CB82]WFU41808.1 hypothetical protein QA640_04680 [Bradyrhizobium sp. CB82]
MNLAVGLTTTLNWTRMALLVATIGMSLSNPCFARWLTKDDFVVVRGPFLVYLREKANPNILGYGVLLGQAGYVLTVSHIIGRLSADAIEGSLGARDEYPRDLKVIEKLRARTRRTSSFLCNSWINSV